ncbi:MAG: dTDP-4-dehydrorhamnose reductase [Niabella sp.]
MNKSIMANQKILVTGANGQLGSELRALSESYPGYDFAFTDRQELSITDEASVSNFFDAFQPDFCINCAAYTAVDKAEDPAEKALVASLNADAVGYLAKACAKHNAKFIHISTDYVFDGNGTEPYKVDDITRPVSMYGITKLEGEKNAASFTDAIIIRTAWVYSSYGKNFVKTMMKLMQERPQLNVVSDQYGTPTYAADLAAVIMKIIASGKWEPGIYHYTNEGKINWYEFAVAIKDIIHADCIVNAIPSADYPTPAKRPACSVLDKSRIVQIYNISIPDWKKSLEICIKKLL